MLFYLIHNAVCNFLEFGDNFVCILSPQRRPLNIRVHFHFGDVQVAMFEFVLVV